MYQNFSKRDLEALLRDITLTSDERAEIVKRIEEKEKSLIKRRLVLGWIFIVIMLCCIAVGVGLTSSSTPKSNIQATESFSAYATNYVVTVESILTSMPTTTPVPTLIRISTAHIPTVIKFPKTNLVGDKVEDNGYALTILYVYISEGDGFWNPEQGNVYLVIEVLIENISSEYEIPYNPLYFSVKDSLGYEFNGSLFGTPYPSLKSGVLLKGEKSRGFVAFEVPATSTTFTVTYEPVVIFGGYEPIKIYLGQ